MSNLKSLRGGLRSVPSAWEPGTREGAGAGDAGAGDPPWQGAVLQAQGLRLSFCAGVD